MQQVKVHTYKKIHIQTPKKIIAKRHRYSTSIAKAIPILTN